MEGGQYTVEARSDTGQRQTLTTQTAGGTVTVPFRPPDTGQYVLLLLLLLLLFRHHHHHHLSAFLLLPLLLQVKSKYFIRPSQGKLTIKASN